MNIIRLAFAMEALALAALLIGALMQRDYNGGYICFLRGVIMFALGYFSLIRRRYWSTCVASVLELGTAVITGALTLIFFGGWLHNGVGDLRQPIFLACMACYCSVIGILLILGMIRRPLK